MNKNIKLAVAGAVLAFSATAANAGIVIPAGDWSLDVSGNVNMFSAWTKSDANHTVNGGLTGFAGAGNNTSHNMTTGLLPNFLSIGGTTRQNDLDVSFVISIQPGSSNTNGVQDVNSTGGGGLNNRQSFITFGDKSWGSVKVGKDLGIFASDAILSDMTLLGVGAPTAAGGNTTLGRIGAGYIYADWKPQIAYTTPNFSGFQATAGISQAWNQAALGQFGVGNSTRGGAAPAYEGKASYSFDANGVNGKIWVSGIAQKIDGAGLTLEDTTVYAGDIGAKASFAGFDVVGYYYGGSGIGTTGQMIGGLAAVGGSVTGRTCSAYAGNSGNCKTYVSGSATGGIVKQRDSDGGYVQAMYTLPTKTKLGVSWGISNLDLADGETSPNLVSENEMWTAGVYHPLTKHLNLVAEYSYLRSTNQADQENKNYTGSLGAILFF